MAQNNDKWQMFQFCQQIKAVEIGQSLIITEEVQQMFTVLADMWLSRQLGGKLGGASTSEIKRKSSAENGKKGGRPKQVIK